MLSSRSLQHSSGSMIQDLLGSAYILPVDSMICSDHDIVMVSRYNFNRCAGKGHIN